MIEGMRVRVHTRVRRAARPLLEPREKPTEGEEGEGDIVIPGGTLAIFLPVLVLQCDRSPDESASRHYGR